MEDLAQNQNKIVIAIDVDGVISPVTGNGDTRPIEDREPSWSYRNLGDHPSITPSSVLHQVLVANPVCKLLHDLVGAEHVEVMMHSTWREDASEVLCPVLGLPNLPQFGTEDEYRGTAPGGSHRWWKLVSVERFIRENPDTQLIWVDDDISGAIQNQEVSDEILANPNVTIVSPDVLTGLTSTHLDVIRAITKVRRS